MNENVQKREMIEMTELLIDKFKAARNRKIFTAAGISSAIIGGVALAAMSGAGQETVNSIANMAMIANGAVITAVSVPTLNVAFSAVKAAKESLDEYKRGMISDEEYETKYLGEMIGYLGTSKEALQEEINQRRMGGSYSAR